MKLLLLFLVLSCKQIEGVVISNPSSVALPGNMFSYTCMEDWKHRNEPPPTTIECKVNNATKTAEWNQLCIPGLNKNYILLITQ